MTARIPILALLVVFCGCASMRLSSRDPLPEGEPIAGPSGHYELVPPSGEWVRADWNEDESKIDLSLAHQQGDAWLNVSVLPDRFPEAADAIAHGRAQVDSMMLTSSREEEVVEVAAPEGPLPARVGTYCGTFDREIRARDSCFVLLATVRDRTSFVLVGQVRVRDPELGRLHELRRLAASLRLTDLGPGEPEGDAEPPRVDP